MSSDCSRRRALKVAVGALCSEGGFSSAEDGVLETLTEMVQSYIFEVGRSTRAFCELSCRTEPMISDVVMSMVEMGTNIQSLPAYAKRANRKIIPAPQAAGPAPSSTKVLPIGERKSHPSHIPDYLPPFPDPHTYIKTLTHREPEKEYQTLREKGANQKRDVERALTRFIAKTGETESLFPDDPYAFPLIANKPKPLPYLDALLPKEQELELSEEENKEKTQPTLETVLETEQRKQEQSKSNPQDMQGSKTQDPSANSTANSSSQSNAAISDGNSAATSSNTTAETSAEGVIDNPYLRPIIMPKLNRPLGKKATYTASLKW